MFHHQQHHGVINAERGFLTKASYKDLSRYQGSTYRVTEEVDQMDFFWTKTDLNCGVQNGAFFSEKSRLAGVVRNGAFFLPKVGVFFVLFVLFVGRLFVQKNTLAFGTKKTESRDMRNLVRGGPQKASL